MNKVKVFTLTEQTPQASGNTESTGSCSNRGVIYQRGFVLPSPTMLMAAVIIGLSISNLLFFNLYRSTEHEYSDFKTRVASESELLRSENERKLQEVTAVHRQVEHDYAKARAALATGPRVVRVRESCSGTGILPTLTSPAQGLDATTEVGTVSAEQCEAIANDGIADATQLMWLQQWVTQTHEASK